MKNHSLKNFGKTGPRLVLMLGLVCGLAGSAFAVRPTTVYLVQHSHSDIGYARPQTDMIADYVRQIDMALDLCEATADYPDDAKFHWTCEVLSAVDHYLHYRSPAEIARFKKWVQKGQVEVTALSLNTSEFTSTATLRAGMRPLAACRALGIPVRLAMQDDVNVFDGVLLEKWFDWRGGMAQPRAIRDSVWVGVEFAAPIALTKYEWYTCEDYHLRDPSGWKFQGSHDGRVWKDLDVVTGYNAPCARNIKACTRVFAR